MMLPNMTPETVTELEQKGFRATPQLCQAASQNPAALRGTLTSVLGSPKEASEVMQVAVFADQSRPMQLSLQTKV